MTKVLAEVDAVGVLARPTLPTEAGGGPNPFFDLQTFLISTQGNWQSSAVYRGGVTAIAALVSRAGGVQPFGGETYITPDFSGSRISTDNLVQAFALFETLGLYFEIVAYPAFVAVPDAAYDDNVPEYMPNSKTPSYPDDPDFPTIYTTWREWKDATHEHYSYEGINYIPLCSDNFSSYVSGSLAVELLNDGFDVQQMQDWPNAEELDVQV